METITLELTAQEADVLLKLIDLAVRGGGMNVAEAAVVLTGRIRQSAQAVLAHKSNGKPLEAEELRQ